MYESKTHFEQIPVETVKKIAKELPEDEGIENDVVNDETQDEVASPEERWREVAHKVQQEEDPQKMLGLFQQLVDTFDDEQSRKMRPRTRAPSNQSGDSGKGQS